MRGGYREGAGRKQGFAAKSAEEARSMLSEMLMREIQPIGEALIKRAKLGEIAATRELFDRAWGRSRQAIEVTVEEEQQTPKKEAESRELAEMLSELMILKTGGMSSQYVLQQLRDMKNKFPSSPQSDVLVAVDK